MSNPQEMETGERPAAPLDGNRIIELMHDQLRQYDAVTLERAQETERAAARQTAEMQRQMEQMQNAMQQLAARLSTPESRTPAVLPPPPVTHANPAPPVGVAKPLLPKPSVFSGEKKTFPAWRRYMKQKLATDVADDRWTRLNYVSAFCAGDAAVFAHDFIDRAETNSVLHTYTDLLDHLSHRYEDPHKKENAMRKLNELQMKGLSFEEFIGKFESLESESGASAWPDAARIQTIKGKLAPWLRELTVLGVDTEHEASVDAYVRRLRKIVNRHNEVKGFSTSTGKGNDKNTEKATKPPPPPVTVHTTQAPGDPMDWVKTNAIATRNDRPHAPAYSEAEYLARLKKKVCTTCGNAGHFSRNCHYRPAKDQKRFKRPNRPDAHVNVALATAAPPTIVTHVDEDNNASDFESEN